MPESEGRTGRSRVSGQRVGPQFLDRIAEPPEAVRSRERLAALHETGLLDSAPEPSFDRLTGLARRLLSAPVILMSLVEAERQFFKSAHGLCEPWASRRETPLSHSFCQHVVQSGDALIIGDARDHPLVCDNAAIADLGVIAYLGVPLIAPDGEVLGSFCAIDSRPRSWTTQDIADLTDLAAVAAVEIAARQYRREREQTEQEMDILVGELDHRIRNMLSVVQAIAKQTGTHTSCVKEFLDAFCGRLGGLAAAHATLMESRWRSACLQRIARGSLEPYLSDQRLRVALPEWELEPGLALALALIFHELATNAIKHGALSVPDGRVTLSAGHQTEPHLLLIWREEGGPPTEPPKRQGFGIRMLQACIAQQGGALELDWRQHGLICRLRLPEG